MKKTVIFIFIFLVFGIAYGQKQINRSQSKAEFKVTNLGLKVEGSIRGMSGEVLIDDSNLESSYINAQLEVRAIRTGIEKRDKHLMKEDFFYMEMYPNLTFESQSISKSGDQYTTIGNLTMRDVTKQIEVNFTESNGTYKGSFTLNRKDYNIHNSSLLTKGISDEVMISLEVVLDE